MKLDVTQIIEGCKKNDPFYQRAFVREYSGLLFAIIKRYIPNIESAKDVLQQSLYKILDKITTFDASKGHIKSWISTIAIRTSLNHLQKRRLETIDIEDVYETEVQLNPTVLEQLSMQELYKLIHTLPDKYREVFNLAVIDGYSHQEIGDLLGIESASSRTRLFRANAMLRNQLEQLKKKESWIKIS